MAVGAATFVRLKLRMMGNGLRGERRRIVAFVFSVLFGVWLAGAGVLFFLGSGLTRYDVGYVMAAYVGTAIVLGWVLLPLLFFGVDETLDPARFALLPLRRLTLARGMLAGALVGIPGAATALAMIGAAIAGGLRAGLGGALVGLVGAFLSLLLCVLASRAVTSAFAAMLRSRRVRDLAAVVLALVAASIGPTQLLIGSVATHATLAPALRLARVLGWTPLAAGFVAPYDVVDGRPALALVRLLIVAGTCAVLVWWWSLTMESAMIGSTASGPARARTSVGGPVATLLPRVLRLARPGRFTAIVGRELRYWSRDPRRRAGLISIMVGGAVVPIALRVVPGSHGKQGAPLPLAIAFSAVAGAAILANQFGFDGSAYAAHLLAAVPGRTELRARATAVALIMLPVVTVLTVVVALISRDAGAIPATLGTVGAMFGASMGTSSVISVLAAYPVPESRNAFASGGGSGSAKGLLSLAGMVGAIAASAPVLLGALYLHGPASWLLAPVGIAWGLAAVLLATYLVGDVLDRRGPELLIAVTPRR